VTLELGILMRTITTPPPVAPLRLHGGRPILEPLPEHAWESRVVLNPAACLLPYDISLETLCDAWDLTLTERTRLRDAGGVCVMLYRAQGAIIAEKRHAPSYLGLALFTPALEIVRRYPAPVLTPEAPFHNLGVEDPRCTRVDDAFYLYYTGYATDYPGDPDAPRHVRICLATTRDFLDWTLHGPVGGDVNTVDNKNAALLPRPVGDRWLLLHRPMEGPGAMAVHLAEAERPEGPWRSRGLLMQGFRYREFARSWIGAGGPPLHLDGDRFLMIYHQGHFTPEGCREYDLAAALLDLSAREPVCARIEPLMRPTEDAERRGDAELGVDNVLFTCANYRWNDRLVIPYAGADSRIFGASVSVEALVTALEQTDVCARLGT